MNLTERDSLILEAAIEFGPDFFYKIKNGTLGLTLYIEASNKPEASAVRRVAPCYWNDLYVVVLYTSDPDFSSVEPQGIPYYDPELS